MRKNNNADNSDKACKDDKDASDISHAIDTCLSLASRVQCVKVRIYNFIRDVGRGEITADNALHCLVEDYKNLGDIGDDLGRLIDDMMTGEDSNG